MRAGTKRHRGDRERNTEGRVALGSERPVECRAQVIELGPVRGEPFARRLRPPLSVSALKEIAVVLGVAPPEALDLTALGELLPGVCARRLEQAIPRDGAADIDRDE